MSLEPLLTSPYAVQIHAYSAMTAFILGLVQFIAPKGTLPHKTLGIIWVVLMTVIVISSIFIRQWFGPLHAFTVITASGIIGGLYHLSRGGEAMKEHYKPFRGIFIGGLIIAGAFSFLPGRIMHTVVFGSELG